MTTPTPNDIAAEDAEAQALLADAAGNDDADTPEGNDAGSDARTGREALRKKNAEARRLRERLKQLEPLAQRAKELEDAQKTEAERAAEKLTAAEKRAAEAELRVLRQEVAAEKGLSPAQAKRLQGTTREELEADAEELAEVFGTAKPPNTQRTPKEKLRGGATPPDANDFDPDKVADQLFSRRRGW